MGPVILNGIIKSLDGYSASESGFCIAFTHSEVGYILMFTYVMLITTIWCNELYYIPFQILLLGRQRLLHFKLLDYLPSACLTFSGINLDHFCRKVIGILALTISMFLYKKPQSKSPYSSALNVCQIYNLFLFLPQITLNNMVSAQDIASFDTVCHKTKTCNSNKNI